MKHIELKQIIKEEIRKVLSENKILIPRRSPEERSKNAILIVQKQIQQYIKDGGKGNLDINSTPIKSLPNNLNIGGSLIADSSLLTSIPNDLKVGKDLTLSGTSIISLPNNLIVNGSLDLEVTPITSLPNNLVVGDNLILNGSSISSLPKDLKVGGFLDLSDTPLAEKYTPDEIRQLCPGIKGDIITSH